VKGIEGHCCPIFAGVGPPRGINAGTGGHEHTVGANDKSARRKRPRWRVSSATTGRKPLIRATPPNWPTRSADSAPQGASSTVLRKQFGWDQYSGTIGTRRWSLVGGDSPLSNAGSLTLGLEYGLSWRECIDRNESRPASAGFDIRRATGPRFAPMRSLTMTRSLNRSAARRLIGS
jgi:hypothetical protein